MNVTLHRLTSAVVVLLFWAVPAWASDALGADRAAFPETTALPIPVQTPPRYRPAVANRVLDLLDGSVVFGGDREPDRWESRVIDTSEFTRIGLHARALSLGYPVSCRVAWRFSDDDPFVVAGPGVTLTVSGTVPDAAGEFGDVRGLEAKVVCGVGTPSASSGTGPSVLGEDPPEEITVLQDVKVLLRWE